MSMTDSYFTVPKEFHKSIENALNNKRHRIYVIVFSTVFFCSCFFYAYKQINISFEQQSLPTADMYQQEPNNTPIINSMLDFTVFYSSIEEMFENSDCVVAGKIIKNETFLSSGTVFTNNQLKIRKVYKGTPEIEFVQIIEWGGYLNENEATEYINKAEYNNFSNGVIVSYAGYMHSLPGDEVILFLTKCEDDMIINILGEKNNLYYVAGAVQGKFKLEQEFYISCSPYLEDKDGKYTEEEFEIFVKKFNDFG